MSSGDTIVALSTPPGRGALALIRASGPQVPDLTRQLNGGVLPAPRAASLRVLHDAEGRTLDQGVLTFYPAPASATGEDVLEISCHGAPAVVEALLLRLRSLGVRPAEPGEFSRRAFEAGKMDLAQAQAVADLVAATTGRAARCAARVLKGDISREISSILQEIVDIRVYIEGALDFPDEDVDWLAESDFGTRLSALSDKVEQLVRRARQGRTVAAGIRLALLGPPNVGKSSLLNHFTGADTAIVTAQPGTTRDVLTASFQIDGIPLILADTAGIRAAEAEAEVEGIRRSWRAAEEADLILQVFDAHAGWSEDDEEIRNRLPERPALALANKCDLLPDGIPGSGPGEAIRLSAKFGHGIEALKEQIIQLLELENALEEDEFMAHQRQIDALLETGEALKRAAQAQGGELVAEELRLAQEALGALTGEFTADDLLGEIFSRFCIGK